MAMANLRSSFLKPDATQIYPSQTCRVFRENWNITLRKLRGKSESLSSKKPKESGDLTTRGKKDSSVEMIIADLATARPR